MKINKAIESFINVQKVSSRKDLKKSGVYLLTLNEEVMYVGSSINLFSRINSHIRENKKFDTIYIVHCFSKKQWLMIERSLIKMYMPPENKKIPK